MRASHRCRSASGVDRGLRADILEISQSLFGRKRTGKRKRGLGMFIGGREGRLSTQSGSSEAWVDCFAIHANEFVEPNNF